MMKDKKELAKLIYEELKKGDIKSALFLISKELEKEKTEKLSFTKTPLLNSIGQELGRLLIKEDWKFERLMELWKEDERDKRLIVISALGNISKKDYENSKQFVLSVLNDISNWEICDLMALRVIVNLAVQNQKEMFSLMHEWIKSENKWVRRLAVATIPPYIRAKKTESKICLELLDNVMREVTKKDPNSVFNFLSRHTKIEDKNTRLMIKEGMKKLSKEKQEKLKVLIGG
ncbi:MAG: DNA alkylation repair protein [Patescibacteria group bacterium]|nr:DNA alkylation repair protein [Patescibacteria group bacterium]